MDGSRAQLKHRSLRPAAAPGWAILRHGLLAACLVALPRAAGGGVPVDTGHFQVDTPGDAVWETAVEPDRVLMRIDREESGRRVGTTAILIMRTKPGDAECGLPAAETAARYCDDEELQLWLNGQVSGLFGVSGLQRQAVELDGKTLYAMHYHLEFAEEYGGAVTDNRLYLYFPPSFAIDNYFYAFMQTEACMPEHCPDGPATMDESPLRAVMSSLRIPAAESQ